MHIGAANQNGVGLFHAVSQFVIGAQDGKTLGRDIVQAMYFVHGVPPLSDEMKTNVKAPSPQNICAALLNGAASLQVFFLEFFHEGNQGLYTFARHRVVDAGAHAANATVPLDALDPGFLGFGNKLRVKIGIARNEWNVHDGAVFLARRTLKQLALVEEVVQQLRLFFGCASSWPQGRLGLKP